MGGQIRPQMPILKGFWDLWAENRGAPKTPNSTTTDLTPHLRPSDLFRGSWKLSLNQWRPRMSGKRMSGTSRHSPRHFLNCECSEEMKEKTAKTWPPRFGLGLPDVLLPDVRNHPSEGRKSGGCFAKFSPRFPPMSAKLLARTSLSELFRLIHSLEELTFGIDIKVSTCHAQLLCSYCPNFSDKCGGFLGAKLSFKCYEDKKTESKTFRPKHVMLDLTSGKNPWVDAACADCSGFWFWGAADARLPSFVQEPQMVPPRLAFASWPPSSKSLDLLSPAPLPLMQNQDAQHKFLQQNMLVKIPTH